MSAGGVAPLVAINTVVIPVDLMTNIEANRLMLLHGSLPVRLGTVISAHYLIAIGAALISVIPGLVVTTITPPGSGEALWHPAAAIGVALAVVAILLPLYKACGAQTGSLALILGVFIIAAAVPLIGQSDSSPSIALPGWGLAHEAASSVLNGSLMMLISWAVSTAIDGRQDH